MKIPTRYLTVAVISIVTVDLAVGVIIRNKHRNTISDGFLLNVWGEVLGEYDEKLFWRLKIINLISRKAT